MGEKTDVKFMWKMLDSEGTDPPVRLLISASRTDTQFKKWVLLYGVPIKLATRTIHMELFEMPVEPVTLHCTKELSGLPVRPTGRIGDLGAHSDH